MGRVRLAQHIEFVSRLTLVISAVGAVAMSVALAWTCGKIVGIHQITGLHVLFGVEPATAFAITYTIFPIVKALFGIVLAGADIGRWAKCVFAIVWLLLLLYVWFVNAFCLVIEIRNGVAVVGAVLIIEILSGCLPALALILCQSPRTVPPGTQPANDPHSIKDLAPRVQVAPQGALMVQLAPKPTFPDVQAFIRYVQNFGSAEFPGVRLNADRSLDVSQRPLSHILGMSLGSCNKLLHREQAAGRLLLDCSARKTRITLPAGDTSSVATRS